MTPKPRARLLPSPPERLALAIAAVAALAAWVFLEASGDGNLGVLLFFAVFAVHALAGPAIRLRAGAAADADPADSFGERVLALAAPRKVTWWLPVALLPIMLLTTPIAYHQSPGNNSIIGLAFATALFAGTIGTVIGSGIWTLVVGPILLATRAHAAHQPA